MSQIIFQRIYRNSFIDSSINSSRVPQKIFLFRHGCLYKIFSMFLLKLPNGIFATIASGNNTKFLPELIHEKAYNVSRGFYKYYLNQVPDASGCRDQYGEEEESDDCKPLLPTGR